MNECNSRRFENIYIINKQSLFPKERVRTDYLFSKIIYLVYSKLIYLTLKIFLIGTLP